MLSLYFSVNFQVAVEFLSRSLYEFLALSPIYQLYYDTAKTSKEILIVLEMRLLSWCGRPQNIGETILRFRSAGHWVTIWHCGAIC